MVQQTLSKPAAQLGGESFHSRFLSSHRLTPFLTHPPQLAKPVSAKPAVAAPCSKKTDNQAQDSLKLASTVKPNRHAHRAAMSQGIDINGDGYLRLSEVLLVYPVSRAAWYAGISKGVYPRSVPLGKRAVGWTRESIRLLIANPPKF